MAKKEEIIEVTNETEIEVTTYKRRSKQSEEYKSRCCCNL